MAVILSFLELKTESEAFFSVADWKFLYSVSDKNFYNTFLTNCTLLFVFTMMNKEKDVSWKSIHQLYCFHE